MHSLEIQKRINQEQQDRFEGKESLREDEETQAERLRIKTESRKAFFASREGTE